MKCILCTSHGIVAQFMHRLIHESLHTKSRPQNEGGMSLLCAKPASSVCQTCGCLPNNSLVSSCVELESSQCNKNCCAACNGKHKCVLQCIITSVWCAGLTRLWNHGICGGVGVCVNETIADVSGVYHRNVLGALVNLNRKVTVSVSPEATLCVQVTVRVAGS